MVATVADEPVEPSDKGLAGSADSKRLALFAASLARLLLDDSGSCGGSARGVALVPPLAPAA